MSDTLLNIGSTRISTRIRLLYLCAVGEEAQGVMHTHTRKINSFQKGQNIFPKHMTKSKSETFVVDGQKKEQGKCCW